MIFVLIAIIVIAIIWAFGAIITTQQQEVKIIERFGKFSKVATAGMSFKTPFFESVAGRLNLKLQQADVQVQAKTKDNVFIGVVLSVQYQVMADKAVDAFYKLQDPVKQIENFVFNIVRSAVPTMTLDEIFVNQDQIATAVDLQLEKTMTEFGYQIYKVLVTQVNPAASIVQSMNDVKASEQQKITATNKAAATKITMVAQAEAEMETKKLSGQGVAAERQAIVDGLKASADELAKATASDPKDAMTILLLTQYFDMLAKIGATSNTIMLPHSPAGLTDITAQIRDAVVAAKQV